MRLLPRLPQSPPSPSVPRHFPFPPWTRALLAVCAVGLGSSSATAAPISNTVVISQIYGGGGNTGASYLNDYIVLHNISNAPVVVTGWSLQYASATGTTTWSVANLPAGSISAGSYYLVKMQSGGAVGTALPTEDASATTINMSATAGKVALANTTTALSGANPSGGATVVDFVGFGSTANASETAAAPAPSATNSISRKDVGSLDTNNNSTDFLAGAAAPRNSATTPYIPTNPGPPTIATLTPANGATGVPTTTALTILFNKPIVKGVGNITVKLNSNSSTFSTVDVTTTAVSISNATATITLPASLAQGTAYYVNVDAAAFKDLSDQSFAGITNNSTWTFTTFTPDVTPPAVTTFSPVNGATGIQPPTNLQITFNESVVSVGGKYITVRKLSDGSLVEAHEASVFDGVSVTGSVATITLSSQLKYGVAYYVEIDAGAFNDNSGNPYAGITGSSTWNFTTTDVPAFTSTPYTQTFASYTSAATLPLGWSASGPVGYLAGYEGNWGAISQGGFRGNASVFGYHHTSLSLTTNAPLIQTLTLRNTTGAILSDLTIQYKGRSEIPANTRIPVYTVSVVGTVVSALAYSTADGDNLQRSASVSGLTIADGDTFQIQWSSAYPSGSGSARQIGISDVSVSATVTLYPPTVAGLDVPVASINSTAVTANANVTGDGGQTVTARGFVYSVTSVNSAPQIGGTGVSTTVDGAPATGSMTASITGLTAATNYTIRAYATNTIGTSYTGGASFTTLATPPTLATSYSQPFNAYNGTNPAGWTALSDFVPPLQAYAGAWGQSASTGGFLGGVSSPGALGYRHTVSSGNLTVTLRMINGTGATLTSLYVSYLGRVERITEGRSPKWTVSVAGSAPVAALGYDTLGNVDATLATTVTGLSIASGAEFTITWVSDRGLSGTGSSKQIALANVVVATSAPSGYEVWKTTNVGGQTSSQDFDNDGLPNGVEYFMGTAGNASTPSPGIVSGSVTWPRASGTTIASFRVETSPNLSTWSDASVSYPANLSISASQVVFTMPTSPTSLFVRLVVTP